MATRSAVLDRTVVQISGDAIPMNLNLSYHVWLNVKDGNWPQYSSPHALIGNNWIETIGPEAGVTLCFVDDPRSWTLPDFQQAVIEKIHARLPIIGEVIQAHHQVKDISWELVRSGPNVGDPLLTRKINYQWEWNVHSRSISQEPKGFKYSVHVTGVEPQPTPRRCQKSGRVSPLPQIPHPSHRQATDPFDNSSLHSPTTSTGSSTGTTCKAV
jgi:hypothetical protein